MGISIRKAEARDVPHMLALVKELAVFEKEPEAVAVTEAEMLEDGFGKRRVWFGWVAEGEVVRSGLSVVSAVSGGAPNNRQLSPDNCILGIAICYDRYSTWKGRCLYLEDIVVTDAARGQGIGEALFRECVKHAVANDYHAMRWQVLDWNEGAIRFYQRLGAAVTSGWLNGDLTRDQMERMVAV